MVVKGHLKHTSYNWGSLFNILYSVGSQMINILSKLDLPLSLGGHLLNNKVLLTF